MTDDDIDAILVATPSILSCRTPDEATRAVFIAGMLWAAQIAREYEFARGPADAIERAAGGEG